MLYEFVIENYLLLTTLFLASLLTVAVYHTVSRKKWNTTLPPGPYPYPIIGNMLDLKGKEIGTYFEQCRAQYGDTFSLRIFGITLVVINGLDALKDAFISNGHLFSGRPKLSFHSQGGIVTGNGEPWKINRRFTLQTLRDFGMGRNTLQVKIHEEIEHVLFKIEQYGGNPFDIGSFLNCAIANVICSIVFGKRFAYNDDKFLEHLQRVKGVAEDALLFVAPSFLEYVPGDPFGKRASAKRIQGNCNFYNEIIDKRLEEYDDNNTNDLLDAYIKKMKSVNGTEEASTFNRQELLMIIADLIGAGMETTATALKWGLIYLLRDQTTQNKLYKEIQENLSHDRFPEVGDKLKLPFVEATVMEILRLGNIVPLGVPHTVTQDCTFRGFHIPKDAFILPNLQSVLYDNAEWGDPLNFRPSRFIGQEGTVVKKDHLIPFSIGRRTCLGESLARMELFLFFSAMVQGYKFLPPENEDPPGLEPTLGVTRAPKSFMMRAIKRDGSLLDGGRDVP